MHVAARLRFPLSTLDHRPKHPDSPEFTRLLPMICLRVLLFATLLGATSVSRAVPQSSAPRELLLDGMVLVNGELVVVGERGAVYLSTDAAVTWNKRQVPTATTLTGVSFADHRYGWAVGHGGTILASSDGGLTWTRQAVDESSDTSFLDVLAFDPRTCIAVGAFGVVRITKDGGATWMRAEVPSGDSHLNRLTLDPTGLLFLAGERGTLLRSRDRGTTWEDVSPDYEGSLFGVLPLRGGLMLAYGLRGRLFRTENRGDTWSPVEAGRPALIATAVRLKGGRIIAAGAARWFFVSDDQGLSFVPHADWHGGAISRLIELPTGFVLALGEEGAVRLPAEGLARR